MWPVSHKLHYIKKEKCTSPPHYPAGSVISYLCSSDLSHTEKGYLWNLIAEVCRLYAHIRPQTCERLASPLMCGSCMNLGHAVTDVQRWWVLAPPLCQICEVPARPRREAAAGLDMTDSNLFPAGVETTWGLQVLIQDGAGFRYIPPSTLWKHHHKHSVMWECCQSIKKKGSNHYWEHQYIRYCMLRLRTY